MDFSKALDELVEVVGERDIARPVPYWLPTTLPNVNQAVSGRPDLGFPGGRLIFISGPESCGKTALATEIMQQSQTRGGFAFLADYEHAFHHGHAERQGLNCDDEAKNWFYKKPASAEEGLDLIYKTIKSLRASEIGVTLPTNTKEKPQADGNFLRAALAKYDLTTLIPIVGLVDSVASMIPLAADVSFEKQNMKTKNMALPEIMSVELKRMARDADRYAATMIFLNQLRTNPGVMFGDNTTEPGGNAPKYYASLRLRLRRVSKWFATYNDPKSQIIGDVVEMNVLKNKVSRPFVKTQYVFRTVDPVGLDLAGTMIHLGKNAGILGPVDGLTVQLDGKKTTVDKLWNECQSDPAAMKKLVDHVMGKTMPVSDWSEEEKNAFALEEAAAVAAAA